MKRPKQQTGPLSFLNFFSRKPKSETKPERLAEAQRPKEEVAITLTPSEHPEQVRLRCSLSSFCCHVFSIHSLALGELD